MHRTLVRWDGPRHPAFNTYSARLRSFDKAWLHDSKPTAETLRAAGLFYIGTDLVITTVQSGTPSTLHIYTYINIFQLLTGRDDRTLCFHCGGGLQDWLDTDDPWSEHVAWFSNCVYIRYIRREVVPPIKQTST